MVDYYQLLSKAVAGIPQSMPGARRALYERARKLLTTELQGPLAAAAHDIEAERISLEEAITRIEGEMEKVSAPARAEQASKPPTPIKLDPPTAPPPAGELAAPPRESIPATPIVQISSSERNPEKPSLSDLMRIVDEALKDPAPPSRPRIARRDAAPTPFLRSPARESVAGRGATAPKIAAVSTAAARVSNPIPERRLSEGPELRLLIGEAQPRDSEPSASKKADLNRILRNQQTTSPGIEASALISRRGQMIASAMAPLMDETRIAGVTATLLKLGGRASVELARGEVREVIIRSDRGYAVMIGAGQDSVLLTLANESSSLGYIFFGMQETVKALENVM